jgi:hypothetical protein
MASEPDSLVLQHLRAIREQIDLVNDRLLELTQRVGSIEVQIANVSVRVDRIDARLDRVERRLGLIEVLPGGAGAPTGMECKGRCNG